MSEKCPTDLQIAIRRMTDFLARKSDKLPRELAGDLSLILCVSQASERTQGELSQKLAAAEARLTEAVGLLRRVTHYKPPYTGRMDAERRFRIAVKDPQWRWALVLDGSKVWSGGNEDAEEWAASIRDNNNLPACIIPSDDAGNFTLPADDPPVCERCAGFGWLERHRGGEIPCPVCNEKGRQFPKSPQPSPTPEPEESEQIRMALEVPPSQIDVKLLPRDQERVDVERLQALYDAATPGEWRSGFSGGCVLEFAVLDERCAKGVRWERLNQETTWENLDQRFKEEDSSFIAVAHNVMAALLAEVRSLRQQVDLRSEPCVIDEARWLAERNAGAESFARMILSNATVTLSPGPCADALAMVNRMCGDLSRLRADRERLIEMLMKSVDVYRVRGIDDSTMEWFEECWTRHEIEAELAKRKETGT